MNISEAILQALQSVRENKLRSSLTLLSIAIGVFALMSAGSLVTAIDDTVTNEMAALGENTILVKKMPSMSMGNSWRKYMNRKDITYSQYQQLRKEMTTTNFVSCNIENSGFVIKSSFGETDPDVKVVGIDDNYFANNNISVAEGRSFSEFDITNQRDVAIIGNDIIIKAFPFGSALGKKIMIKNKEFEVVGILETKGALLGQSQDNQVFDSNQNAFSAFSDEWMSSLDITIKALSRDLVDETRDEAIGLMRSIRNVKPWEENSFEIETNDTITQQFMGFTVYISAFGYIVGFFSLIAAGVGIMNIMLVSVKERTREIGIRKAIGARKSWILSQFLIETITLCQLGGLIGIILGISASFALSSFAGLSIVMPFQWIIISITICTIIGVAFGIYPAYRAASLDPIEALRYE